MVDLQLGGKAESSSLPDILSKSSEGSAGFGNPVFDFGVNVHYSRECIAQIGEVFNCLEVLPIHCDAR